MHAVLGVADTGLDGVYVMLSSACSELGKTGQALAHPAHSLLLLPRSLTV